MATIVEIMEAAEDNIQSIMQHEGNSYLRMFMRAAYLPEAKLQLPETDPPYKENAQHEAQVPPGVFWQIAKKLNTFQATYHDKMTILRVENSFIQALESVSAKEAKLILACKNQNIASIYKGVTYDALKQVGYFK